MPRTFTGRCFHQIASNQPWVIPELDRWASGGDDNYRAMGANIECDHRVPLARFEQLAGMPLDPAHAQRPLQVRVDSYKRTYNHNTPTPAFLGVDNDVNIYAK